MGKWTGRGGGKLVRPAVMFGMETVTELEMFRFSAGVMRSNEDGEEQNGVRCFGDKESRIMWF